MRTGARLALVVGVGSLGVAVVVAVGAYIVLRGAFAPVLDSAWTDDAIPRSEVRRVFGVPPPPRERGYRSRQFSLGSRVFWGLLELGPEAEARRWLAAEGLSVREVGRAGSGAEEGAGVTERPAGGDGSDAKEEAGGALTRRHERRGPGPGGSAEEEAGRRLQEGDPWLDVSAAEDELGGAVTRRRPVTGPGLGDSGDGLERTAVLLVTDRSSWLFIEAVEVGDIER